jgi:hypothetical protein
MTFVIRQARSALAVRKILVRLLLFREDCKGGHVWYSQFSVNLIHVAGDHRALARGFASGWSRLSHRPATTAKAVRRHRAPRRRAGAEKHSAALPLTEQRSQGSHRRPHHHLSLE